MAAKTRQSREDKVAELALFIWGLQLDGRSATAIAGRLYDAGYRKTGQAPSGNGRSAAAGVMPSDALAVLQAPPPGTAEKPREKGNCRECGRSFALSHYGVVRKHRQEGSSEPCGGGGQVPV